MLRGYRLAVSAPRMARTRSSMATMVILLASIYVVVVAVLTIALDPPG
jgi:hypothetical protein